MIIVCTNKISFRLSLIALIRPFTYTYPVIPVLPKELEILGENVDEHPPSAQLKKTNSVLNGKIAAVLTRDNEITLKIIKIKNNIIHLIPANKSYTEKVLNVNEVQIQGALTGIIRKYN